MELSWEQVPTLHPQPGVTTRRRDFDQMTVVLYEFEPNAVFPLHSHAEEQLVVMLAGSCRFHVGGTENSLEIGATTVAPPHVPHGCSAGAAGCRFLNILSPRRVGTGDIKYQA